MVVSPARSLATLPPLVALLADGELRSGQWLAGQLGVSRAAVWKAIERLRAQGVAVDAVPRRGYRFPTGVELLADGPIRAALHAERAARLGRLELCFEVDSTNTRLLNARPPAEGSADACLSELQHAGRGRRGRPWIAPFGGSLALSLSWLFRDATRVSPALSLSVGVAVARALARAGAHGIGLKWPNDLWWHDRKVGGILLEMRTEASGPAHIVVGVGLNLALAPAVRAEIESSGVSIATVADACGSGPSRNFLAGAIIDELLSMLVRFERDGFAAFRTEWTALDALADRPARVLMGHNTVSGTARGVDEEGALRLERAGTIERFVAGEVSLRVGEDDFDGP
jgi:BirA family biotin operon repressor/biotin-[acetyl-CoA-carboxylase] ligase